MCDLSREASTNSKKSLGAEKSEDKFMKVNADVCALFCLTVCLTVCLSFSIPFNHNCIKPTDIFSNRPPVQYLFLVFFYLNIFLQSQSVDHQMAEQLLAFEKTSVSRKPIDNGEFSRGHGIGPLGCFLYQSSSTFFFFSFFDKWSQRQFANRASTQRRCGFSFDFQITSATIGWV